MPRRNTSSPTPGITITGPLGTALLGMCGTLIVTGIIATVSLWGHVQSLTADVSALEQSQHITAAALAKHLDNSVDKTDYLRDQARVNAVIEQMATKEDVRLLRDMILDLVGSQGRVSHSK